MTDYIVTRPPPGHVTPSVARMEGSNWVTLIGMPLLGMSAEDAIDFGHRLVEAGLGARRASSETPRKAGS